MTNNQINQIAKKRKIVSNYHTQKLNAQISQKDPETPHH